MNYYNEFNPKAAAMLQQLINDKLIPHGDVDVRSITEVSPDELRGYTQCHFFAGIGGWPLAARLAGLPDDYPLWTGSCPCQSFSTAGKQKGKADERHLWPVWARLIRECKPAVVFGEQVAAAIAHEWLDEVASDMEGEGYAVGSAVLPACSIGAPHKRDRLFFVANATAGRTGKPRNGVETQGQYGADNGAQPASGSNVGHASGERWREAGKYGTRPSQRVADANALGDTSSARGQARLSASTSRREGQPVIPDDRSGGQLGPWEECDWIVGHDGKARPVKPGIRLLADGFPARVACLHGFGNAIVPQVAAEFIQEAIC